MVERRSTPLWTEVNPQTSSTTEKLKLKASSSKANNKYALGAIHFWLCENFSLWGLSSASKDFNESVFCHFKTFLHISNVKELSINDIILRRL